MKNIASLLLLSFIGCGTAQTEEQSAVVSQLGEPDEELLVYRQSAELYRSGDEYYVKVEIQLPAGQKFVRFQIKEGKFAIWGRKLKNNESPATYEMTEENFEPLKNKALTMTGNSEHSSKPITVPIRSIRIIESKDESIRIPANTKYG